MRSPLNQAWYELANAARTNPGLKKAVAPLARRYYRDVAQLARDILPETAELLDPYGEWQGLASVFLLQGFKRGLIPGASMDRARLVRARASRAA